MAGHWTLDSYFGTSPQLRPPFEQIVQDAIRAFVKVHPLDVPRALDGQPLTDLEPIQVYGTITIPLWEQAGKINKASIHWRDINKLLDTLVIAAHFAAEKEVAEQPERYRSAMVHRKIGRMLALGRGTAIAPRTSSSGMDKNCFQSVRLNVNVALERAKPTTFYQSGMAALTVLGEFHGGGQLVMTRSTGGRAKGMLRPGEIALTKTEHWIGSMAFKGERHQLEFFLPDSLLDTK